jgi:hypothetical protein
MFNCVITSSMVAFNPNYYFSRLDRNRLLRRESNHSLTGNLPNRVLQPFSYILPAQCPTHHECHNEIGIMLVAADGKNSSWHTSPDGILIGQLKCPPAPTSRLYPTRSICRHECRHVKSACCWFPQTGGIGAGINLPTES